MSMGYDATASLQPLNYTTSFTNPAQWTMGNNAYLNQYSQGVLGQTLLDTQRSQQHTADLITSAAMAMPNSPGGAYMFSDTGGPAGGWGGNAFNSGAMSNFMTGGGGYNFPSIPDMSGGLGGGGGQQQPINWGSLFGQSVGGMSGGGNADPFPGMSMPGGLNSPMTVPQQQPLDYGSLFGRGAGGMGSGATADPYPAMSMPGGLNSPMSGMDAPMEGAPSSTMDWSTLFGPDTGGMAMPGGLNSPMTVPEAQAPAYDYGSLFGKGTEGAAPPAPDGTRTYDLAPMFEGGGGGGFGTGGADSQLFGGEATGQGGNAFSYNPEPTGSQDVFSQPADALAEQARARLASLMGGQDDRQLELKVDPQDKVAPEQPVAPAEAPAEPPAVTPGATVPATDLYPGDNPPRPPANIPFTVEKGKEAGIRAVNSRLSAAVQGGATFLPPGYTVEAYSGARSGKDQAYHRGGRAMDVRIIGPDGPIPSEGADSTGMYTLLARGVKTWTQQNDPSLAGQLGYGGAFGTKRGSSGGANDVPDLMHYDLGGSRGALRPDVQFGRLQPLTPEERNAMPANIPLLGANQVPLDAPGAGPMGASASVPLPQARPAEAPLETRSGVNQGQNITPPPADIPPAGLVGGGYNALDAAANAPVKHTGLELARANIDTPIEKIAMERGGQKAVDQVSSMAVGMTPRQLQQSYGGMFMSRAEPLFASLGITRQDFEQAAKMPPTRQDLKMRFGGDFGGMGGEEPSPGAFQPYPGWRESANFEDMRGELANLQPREFGYGDLPEVAPTPLSNAAGLGALPMPPTDIGTSGATDFSSQSRRDMPDRGMDPSYWADVLGDDAEGASFNERFTGDAGMRDFQSPANDYSTFQQQPFIDPWQASIPSNVNSPALREAIQQTAQSHDVQPSAVAGVVNTEDPGWNPRLQDPGSSYYGLTQIGPQTFREAPGGRLNGMTWDEYQRASPEQQIATYGSWLDQYGGLERARAAGIDVNALPPEAQAALLQGLQFAPNTGLKDPPGVRDWLTPYAQGDASMATTLKPQAPFLNEHPEVRSERPTMGSMTDYYRRLMANQIAGAGRSWPQQQLFNNYYPTQMPGGR